MRLATLLFALLLPMFAVAALAAEPAQKPSPFAGAATSERALVPPKMAHVPGGGAETGIWGWILAQQAWINRELANAVRNLKSGDTLSATAVLAFLSFAYGVLHAVGPGHGKAVISSYVLANERTVRRGIFLSFLAALFQALSALIVVGVLAILFKATSLQIKSAESWIATVSWGLVAAIGAWLLIRNVSAAFASRPSAAHVGHSHDHAHDHHHGHGHAHDHPHDGHDHSACCGHAHMPAPHQLEGELTWKKAFAIAFAVGIRPCTGAILVLIFALSQGLIWAGVFATFAMALGTAITVSVLAALAVGSRELATRMAGPGSGWAERVELGVGVAGSALVFLMGAAFFVASLQGSAPL